MRSILLLVAVCGLGCASGPPLLLGQPIKKEVAVLVRVSKSAAHTDELGGIASLVDRVSEGLGKRGVKSQVYAADDDHPHAPMIEIRVEKWNAGDSGERAGLKTFGVVGGVASLAESGGYDVIVRIYRDGDTAPASERHYKGMILGTSDSASADAGESVGDSILSYAFNDEPRVSAPKKGSAPP